MADLHAPTAPFVRNTMLPPAPPPAMQAGMIRWLRENLFAGPFNTFLTLAGLFGFALGRELLFGSGRPLPGDELLRAGTLGRVSRLDAAFLLVWLAAALFRGCFLVRVLRELLCRPEEPEKGVPE